MSTIKKMLIRGVRSFGPDQDDEQLVKFDSPLTIILGQNGCGKTTIIESLKYVITGDLPPGSSNGQSFVHDPKVNKSFECRGQIKLMFNDVQGKQAIVTRTFHTQQKQSKLTFKSIDANIAFTDKQGQSASFSKRCGDVDSEMCILLGVSKPILNNVIFCHQEDSDWPMEEGKKLKEKFDAIFDATKYNKCVDDIIKLQKAKQANQKVMDQEAIHLRYIKKDVDSKRVNLNQNEENRIDLEESIKKMDVDIIPITDRIKEINDIQKNIGKLQSEYETSKTMLDNNKEQQAELKSKIKSIFDGNDNELQRRIESFQEELSEQQRNFDSVKEKLKKTERKEEEYTKAIFKAEVKKSELISLRGREQELLADRNRKLGVIAKKLDIPVGDLENTDADMSRVIIQVENKVKKVNVEVEQLAKCHDTEDNKLQEKIDNLREKNISIKQEIDSKYSQISQLEKDSTKLKRDIEAIDSSANKLKVLADKITQSTKEIDRLNEQIDVDSLKQTLTNRIDMRNTMEKNLEKTEKEVSDLQLQSATLAELDVQKQQLSSQQSEVRKMKNKYEDDLKTLFGDKVPTSNYKMAVQNCYEKYSSEVKFINNTISEKEHEVITLKTNLNHNKEQLKKIRQELNDNEEKVYEQCEGDDYDSVIAKLNDTIQKNQNHRGMVSSSKFMYQKYIENLEKAHPACPLCHRDFNSGNEVKNLVDELNNKLRYLPGEIESAERTLKQDQLKYDSLLALRPIHEKISSLQKEIPQLQERNRSSDKSLQNIKSELESLKLSLCEPKTNMELANAMMGDMTLLDQNLNSISKLQIEINKLQGRLPKGYGDRNLQDAQTEQAVLKAELSQIRSEVESLRNKLTTHSEKLQALRESKNKLVEEQLALQSGVQARSQLVENLDKQIKQLEEVRSAVANCLEQLTPLKKELDSAISTKQTTKERNRIKLNEKQSFYQTLQRSLDDINKDTQSLNELAEQDISNQIEELMTSLRNLCEGKTKCLDLKEKVVEEINRYTQDLSVQEVTKRNLTDNLSLRQKQSEERKLSNTLRELQGKIGDMDQDAFLKEKERLIRNHTDIYRKKAENEGKLKMLIEQITSLKRELNTDHFKNAERLYLEKMYRLQINKIIIQDLDKYRKAVEYAILQYHQEKMDKINEIIRDLWRQIYRGNDVDYIEIKTDEASSTGTRRAYNYRVVQYKQDVELDMRGRCSAGQKVLACLIIRMALAEIFSTNCGILALDEPTTNLDRDNISSLCDAFANIVETRSEQKNFMLIIITHDEEFLEALTKVDKLERYHKVTRNKDGKSRITRMSIQR